MRLTSPGRARSERARARRRRASHKSCVKIETGAVSNPRDVAVGLDDSALCRNPFGDVRQVVHFFPTFVVQLLHPRFEVRVMMTGLIHTIKNGC